MTGLNIIFLKSEIFLFGEATDKEKTYREIYTYDVGVLPIKYLGIPLNKIRIRNKDWKYSEDKIEKRCACWQGKMLNIASRLALV